LPDAAVDGGMVEWLAVSIWAGQVGCLFSCEESVMNMASDETALATLAVLASWQCP